MEPTMILSIISHITSGFFLTSPVIFPSSFKLIPLYSSNIQGFTEALVSFLLELNTQFYSIFISILGIVCFSYIKSSQIYISELFILWSIVPNLQIIKKEHKICTKSISVHLILNCDDLLLSYFSVNDIEVTIFYKSQN